MTLALLTVPLVPLFVAALLAFEGPGRRAGLWLAPWAAVPALLVALAGGETSAVSLPWLLLDARLGVDLVARPFLLFTALLWTAAGVFARTYLARDVRHVGYFGFHCLTLAGNLGLIVAQDLVTFYFAFALMTFAGYGLVVHTRTDAARRAGRIYLVMAVAGETMLLAGFVLTATSAPSLALPDVAAEVARSPWRNVVVPLLLAGFGIKAGALPLHVWLPLAHPVAPTPASAVLSGAMIKAGLLGWLRFLPFGAAALPGWGGLLIAMGVVTAFFGVVVGVTQRDPKTTLAYSSISQIGFMNVGAGIALGTPEVWPFAIGATLAYIVHHGLAKGALFLGTGVAAQSTTRLHHTMAIAGLAFAALSVAGAPLTSGGIAKTYLKQVAPHAPVEWPISLELLLAFAALGSTLLMARFLYLVAQAPAHAPPAERSGTLWPPWLALLAAVAAVMWILPGWYEIGVPRPAPPSPADALVMIWPVVGGVLGAWLALRYHRHPLIAHRLPVIAPGDLLLPVERSVGWARRRVAAAPVPEAATPSTSLSSMWYGVYHAPDARNRIAGMDAALVRWRVAITGFVLVLLALFATFVTP